MFRPLAMIVIAASALISYSSWSSAKDKIGGFDKPSSLMELRYGGGRGGYRGGGGFHRGGVYGRGEYGRRYYGGVWYGTGRRYWGGRWWAYGVGSCWRTTPIGFVWVCG